MLGTGTELARGTEKSEAAEAEDGERRRAGSAGTEVSGAGVIGEKVGPRRSKAGDWDRKRCDLGADGSTGEELSGLCCRDLGLEKRAAREAAISRLKRSIARRRDALASSQSAGYDGRGQEVDRVSLVVGLAAAGRSLPDTVC